MNRPSHGSGSPTSVVRYVTPALFLVLFGAVYLQIMTVLSPPFFKYVLEPTGPGQAIREAIRWNALEILVPLAGGIAGAMVACLISRSAAPSAGVSDAGLIESRRRSKENESVKEEE